MENLKKIIGRDAIISYLQSTTKTSILQEMLTTLTESKHMLDSKQALADLLTREKKMSTGMEHGIAFPHAKTDAVDALIAAIAISPQGVEFNALDGNPSHIFVMALSPKHKSGPYIEFIAQISSLLKEPRMRTSLMAAQSSEKILTLLTSSHGSP